MDDPTLAIMSHGSPSKIQSITFLDLSEDLIFGIAFSGYLGFTVKSIVKILLTCRQLYRIGRYQVGIFQFHDQFTQHQWCTISKALGQFDSVSCMDFSYSHSERLPSSILKNLTRWSTTLFGLNFKDTLISDADLKFLTSFDDFEMIHEDQTNEESLKNHSISASSSLTTLESLDVTMDLETDEAISCSSRETQKIIVSQVQYPQLRFLDLSKVKRIDRTLITDEALTPFLRCNQMKWLNLGMTDITNAGIEKIVKAMPHLEYLSIPYCHRLTDHCLYHIKQLPLVVLDITFCRGLTLNAFTILFGDRLNPIAQSLEVLSCPYYAGFSDHQMNKLLNLPKLCRLDCRSTSNESVQVTEEVRKQARQKFKLFVLYHEDQVTGEMKNQLNGLANYSPEYSQMWPLFHWPYCKELL